MLRTLLDVADAAPTAGLAVVDNTVRDLGPGLRAGDVGAYEEFAAALDTVAAGLPTDQDRAQLNEYADAAVDRLQVQTNQTLTGRGRLDIINDRAAADTAAPTSRARAERLETTTARPITGRAASRALPATWTLPPTVRPPRHTTAPPSERWPVLGTAKRPRRAAPSQRNAEMTAAELAGVLGEPLSSTYRMLESLSSVGWVDRGFSRGRYRLGLAMMTIGGLVEDALDIREVARPSLQSLLHETNSTSYLCVRRGSRAVCVERLEGHAVRSLAMQLGGSLPMHAGAAPLALLAFFPRSEQELVLRTGSELPGDPRKPAPAELENVLAAVRKRGYAISDGDVTVGIAALGAPVFNHRRELVASISISGLRAQILGSKLRQNSGLLTHAAREVSAALGDETSR